MISLLQELLAQAHQDKVKKISVGAAIMHNNRVLMLQRRHDDFMPNIFELPGGGTEGRESLLDTLVREIKEETGCDVEHVKQYINHIDFPSSTGALTRRFNFLVNVKNPEKITLSEHAGYAWVDPLNNTHYDITPQTRSILAQLIK